MQKNLDENSYEKRIENIEKGKSYLKINGFLNRNSIYLKTYKGEFMSGDFETLEINQPKIKYLKPENSTKWLDKLINNIEDMKKKISKDS